MPRTRQHVPIRILAIALIAAVLVAGCVGQAPAAPPREVKVVANDGLQLTSFTAEPASVDVGDTVIFTLEVENVGGITATNVLARLLGTEGQWRELSPGNPLVEDSSKYIGSLAPPNPQFSQPGDFSVVTWMYKTPAIAPGLVYTADVAAEVLYNYNTTGALVIKAIGDSFLRTEYIAKGRTPAGPAITNTNAPVKILVPEAQMNYYIRVEDKPESPAYQYKPVQFRLVNVGSGYPVTDGVPGAVIGRISVRGPGNPVFSDCLGQTNTPDVYIDTGSLGADLARLRTSQGAVTISCTVRLDKDAFVLQDEQIRLDFNLGYRYYIQRPVQVAISSVGT
ncbi:MAG: hypothetical protein QW548_02460 [Candidatus Aenigmatarchaeota archaeon]